jgi:hypothetical protein
MHVASACGASLKPAWHVFERLGRRAAHFGSMKATHHRPSLRGVAIVLATDRLLSYVLFLSCRGMHGGQQDKSNRGICTA